MRRWAKKHDKCIKCGKTEHKHIGHGICYMCKRVRKGVRASGSYWNLRDHKVKAQMQEARGDLKAWEPLSDKWIGKTQEEYNGQEYRCSGCEKECIVKSPFKDISKQSIEFGVFRKALVKECPKKI